MPLSTDVIKDGVFCKEGFLDGVGYSDWRSFVKLAKAVGY